jgi:glycosyltransferase involved in cell wall biosynthesis
MPEKVVLIGPYPPPENGIAIAFKLFCDYLNEHYGKQQLYHIIGTGANSPHEQKPLLNTRDARKILGILSATLSCDRIILFGSQRFVTITGSMLVLLYKPFRRKIFIRYNGGGCDIYYQQGNFLLRWLMRSALSRTDAVVVQTEMLQSNMTALWGQKVLSASNYRTPDSDRVEERHFDESSVSFIYAGLVRKLKGVEELLEAFVRLGDRLANEGRDIAVTLDLYGMFVFSKGEPLDISPYLDNPSIRFHGQVDNRVLTSKYYQSDALVFPTYWPTEGHPGAVIEALQCGLPIIASSWRAMSEIVIDEYNGLMCEPKSVDGLVDAMHRICCDLPLRKQLSANAEKTGHQVETQVVCDKMARIFGLNSDESADFPRSNFPTVNG